MIKRKAMTERCLHRNLGLETWGGMHYSGGEVWDDLEDYVICLDCGAEFNDRAEAERNAGFNREPELAECWVGL